MYNVGGTRITFNEYWTEIILPGGEVLNIPWTIKNGDSYLAEKLGYTDLLIMNKDHDPLHALAAYMLGLPQSGPLSYAAGYPIDPMWRYEEAIVFAMQNYLAVSGKPIEAVLEKFKES